MLSKSYTKSGKSCRVTFKLPPELVPQKAKSAALVGEFNEWNAKSHPLKKRKDGSFSTTVSLDAGRSYRFRYLFPANTWVDDDAPDAHVKNEFGGRDCVVKV